VEGLPVRGILFVLSAPSGTGKSSLARRLLSEDRRLSFSVSYTTRSMREGERDGREYHFVDDAAFDSMVERGDLLEWAHVFGRRYGTGRVATEARLAHGSDLLLDIDVQGARQVRESGAEAVFVFVLPPDFASLETRLRSRGTEEETEIERRLAQARGEAEEFSGYDYLVVNDDLDRALDDLSAVVRAERLRTARRGGDARRIVATFP
jgi:guanylate kinase